MADFYVAGSDRDELWVPSSQNDIALQSPMHHSTMPGNPLFDTSLIESFTATCQSMNPSTSISSFPSTKILARDTSMPSSVIESTSNINSSIHESPLHQREAFALPIVPSRPRPRPKPIKRPAEGGIKAAIEGPSFSDIGSSSVVQATPVGQVRERETASQTILPPQLSSAANKDVRPVPTSKKRKRPNVIEIFSDEDDAPQSSASKTMPEPLVEKLKGKKKAKVDKSARVVKEGKEGSEKIFKSKEFVDDDDELDMLGPSAEQHVSTSIIAPTPVKEKKKPKKDKKTAKAAAKDVIALPISDTVIETTHIISNPEEHVGTSGDTTASRKVSSSAQDRDAQARPTKKTNAKENDGNKDPSTPSKSKPPTSETRDTNSFSTSSPRRVLKAVVEISRFSTPKSTGKKPAMVDSPSVDANKSFRVPARTKTPMSELLMKVQQRPSAASPSALKVSRSSLSRIAPLHPNRKPAPPPPPRVSQKERKTKAQQMEEEQWEEEWEEQYGEAWYEMPEEEKARMRRERRDQLWVED